jgi:hypothetical protein
MNAAIATLKGLPVRGKTLRKFLSKALARMLASILLIDCFRAKSAAVRRSFITYPLSL